MLLFLVFSFTLFLMAQKKNITQTNIIIHKLGDDYIRLKIFQYGKKKDIVFINLHAGETTSVTATEKLLQTGEGLLIKIENNNKRNIRFRLGISFYTFDPNRIFSQNGIRQALKGPNPISNKAIEEVEKFANHLLKLLTKEPYCIIALHNNTEGGFSVNSFLPGGEFETDARKVYTGEDQDPDDFFLTPDSILFHQLSSEKYNTVWQDNLRVQQDGSLSVYFGEKNICYLNCETEPGKLSQYKKMITVALKYIGQNRKE